MKIVKRYWLLVSKCWLKKGKKFSSSSSLEHQASSVTAHQSIKSSLRQRVGWRWHFCEKKFGYFIWPGIICLLFLLLQNVGLAADPPDKLYRQGRFEEAEKAYAKADMDHPKDIRFRYNRGCAAFQNGQYKEAEAAFSSVMRRAKDSDVRFRAGYNLGNTAYKQGDYVSAAEHYKAALAANPDSADARYNLELSLRAIEKMKQQQPEAPKDNSQTGEKKEEGKQKNNPAKKEHPQTDEPRKQDQKNEDAPDDEAQKNPENSNPEDSTASGENQNQGSAQDRRPESEAHQDLSGELKLRRELTEMQKKERSIGKS